MSHDGHIVRIGARRALWDDRWLPSAIGALPGVAIMWLGARSPGHAYIWKNVQTKCEDL